MPRRLAYLIVGTLLGLGAPVGWLVFRVLFLGAHPADELAVHRALYWYLSTGPPLVCGIFGWRLGSRLDGATRQAAELRSLSLTDPLTSLGNRRAFEDRLTQECERARRSGAPLTLVMADLDRFKNVNDLHGHDVGDALLTHVGQVIRNATRKGDSACRLGGEEFAILCPDTRVERAAELAERIRRKLDESPAEGITSTARVTASFGAAELESGETDAAFYRRADAAMYRAKELGRNRVFISSPETGTLRG